MTIAATVWVLQPLKIRRTHKYVAWTLASGIFWIFFLLFLKSIQPTACFKCVNTQRGVVEQRHQYFCQTVITDVRFFSRNEKKIQRNMELCCGWLWEDLVKKKLSISYSLRGYSSLYSTFVLCSRFKVTSRGKRGDIFTLFNFSLGTNPSPKVSVDRTVNKMLNRQKGWLQIMNHSPPRLSSRGSASLCP